MSVEPLRRPTRRLLESWALAVLIAPAPLTIGSCEFPQCAQNNFGDAECRVLAEYDLAEVSLPDGIRVSMQPPTRALPGDTAALGLVHEVGADEVRVRVAGFGPFAIALESTVEETREVRVIVENVASDVRFRVGPPGGEEELDPAPEATGLVRDLGEVELRGGDTIWIRGEPATCPDRFRIAALGDIQTNPLQFRRIIEALRDEHERSQADGAPLMGLAILGDLTEWSYDEQFRLVDEITRSSPVPVAVTPGNHDIFRTSSATYNLTFGPGNHAFSACGLRMVMLDTGNGSMAPSVEGRLPTLLEKQEDDRWLLIGTHYPPHAGLTGAGWNREDQAQHLMIESVIAGADLLLAGHNHALRDFPAVPVGGQRLHEIIAGTGGASQGVGVPRYGYVRVELADTVSACFVEVPPPGAAATLNQPLAGLPYCED
jgi:hypothetical protein